MKTNECVICGLCGTEVWQEAFACHWCPRPPVCQIDGVFLPHEHIYLVGGPLDGAETDWHFGVPVLATVSREKDGVVYTYEQSGYDPWVFFYNSDRDYPVVSAA